MQPCTTYSMWLAWKFTPKVGELRPVWQWAARRWGRSVRCAVRVDVEALVFLDDPAVVSDHRLLVPAVQNCDDQATAVGKIKVTVAGVELVVPCEF